MDYISGRGNLSATIFVPFDCSNNCLFCTSKQMYKDMEMNIQKIKYWIQIINLNDTIKEFVFTGGEPFANLDVLNELLSLCHKPVYINTTLPKNAKNSIEDIIHYINTNPNICGINISRHIGFNFTMVASKEEISLIQKPIHINTVINKNFSLDKFLEFVEEYGNVNRLITLRADYTKITKETLKVRDEIDDFLLEHFNYFRTNSCMVCNSEIFVSNDFKFQIMYHRGLQYSSFIVGERKYVNDVIITPNGNIYSDWDMKEDIDFNKWLLKDFLNK